MLTKGLLNYAQRLRRLRHLAIGFLLILLVPLGTLLYFGFGQIEHNLMVEYQREANNLVHVANRNLFKRRMLTNTLSVDAFDYYQQVYNPITKQTQQVLSPLSQLAHVRPKTTRHIQGLVGYYQYNSQGHFNSPIWPYALDNTEQQETNPELAERKKVALDVYQLLSQSKKIQQILQQEFVMKNGLFKLIFDVPEYFIFSRIVEVAGQKRMQGYVVERKPYLPQLFTDILALRGFDNPVLVELKGADEPVYFLYQNQPDTKVKVSQPQQADKHYQQQPIYNTKLRWPFEDYAVTVSTHSFPMTPAMVYSGIFIMILIAAILTACYGFYRLGVKQLALGEQRLNFVSSVSHELKTPLTSIQMYSQMLKEGTVVAENYKKEYYQFIFAESERLTRLINNILQLSKLSNQQQSVQSEYIPLPVLMDIIRSKTSSIIEQNGFEQNMLVEMANAEDRLVFVETDAFSQVVINIIDNAVKFFDREQINDPDRQKIDFIFRQHPKHKDQIEMEIRDYGEGITLEQESKIFELFYRGGGELTRTTQGTGIGLALVNELVLAQRGEIRVQRRDPGLAMVLCFYAK